MGRLAVAMTGPTAAALMALGVCVAPSPARSAADAPATAIAVTNLRCESETAPVGVGTAVPRLGWVLESPLRGQRQAKYQVLAATRPDLLVPLKADLWDTGAVVSDESIQVPWRGKALRSAQAVYWTVRAWDACGHVSAWAEPTSFTLGLLRDSDWQARWIGHGAAQGNAPHPLAGASWIWDPADKADDDGVPRPAGQTVRHFRHTFTVPGGPAATATLHLCADNTARVFLNGKPLADVPDTRKTTILALGSALAPGAPNTLAISVKNEGTTTNPAGLIASLLVERADGTSTTVNTDAQWLAVDPGEGTSWTLSADANATRPARVLGAFGMRPWYEPELPSAYPPLPIFRHETVTARPVRRATAFVCGLGHHDLFIDGRKAGEDFLEPAWSGYDKTRYYSAYDVTAALGEGRHALGVMLGKGFYNNRGSRRIHGMVTANPLMLIVQVNIEYADGTTGTIVSDGSWKWTEGPLLHDSILSGSDYDARRLPDGWAAAGYDDKSWKTAVEMPVPGAKLIAREGPPLREHERFAPKSVDEPEPGVFVYDFGQNASARPWIRVQGTAGQVIRLAWAEHRQGGDEHRNNGTGRVDQRSVGGNTSYMEYTLRGGPEETWTPPFFYTGYQFLELTGGVPEGRPNPGGLPVVKEIVSVHVRNAAETVGEFACSNPVLNDTNRLIDWSVRSNMSHVLTDCPHREKLGWLEVPYLMWPSIAMRYDLSRFAAKICRDVRDAQRPDGCIRTVAPDYQSFSGGFLYTPEWGAAGVFLPWYTYQWYGDTRTLEASYDSMRRFVDYVHDTSDGLIPKAGLGDWYDYGHGQPVGASRFTPVELSATTVFHECARVVAHAARALGRRDEQIRYEKLAVDIASAFDARFSSGTAEFANNGSCQAGSAMALVSGVVRPSRTGEVFGRIVEELQARNWQQTPGDVGFVYLVRALMKWGRGDVLYRIATRMDLGSYGFIVKAGWTSMPESWDALRRYSMNHCMLGHIQEWFYKGLGGVRPVQGALAFKRFEVRPDVVGGITSSSVSHRCPYGWIRSAWRVEGGRFVLDVEVPVNTTALVFVPAKDAAAVTEGGKPALSAEGVRHERMEGSSAVFRVGSGRYSFETPVEKAKTQ